MLLITISLFSGKDLKTAKTCDENNTVLSAVDFSLMKEKPVKLQSSSSTYIKRTDKKRYSIGKYTSENGNAATVRHFIKEFPKLKESTVREFKKRYEKQLQEAKKKHIEPKKSISKYQSKPGRPLILGKFDSMVQSYI